jgi:sec-independent protein translocase protein TatC
MALVDHLRELRYRVIVAAIAVVITTSVALIFHRELSRVVMYPITTAINDHLAANPHAKSEITINELTGGFMFMLKIAGVAGLIVSCPIWLYQLWAFIVPGLTKKERRISLAFIAAIVPLFLGGCALAYWVLPKVLAVLYGFTPPGASNIQQVADYFSFVTRFILAFGGAFLMPVFLVALSAIGILPSSSMVKAWRPAVFGIFVLSAALTPTPDAFTMFLMAGPLVVLYFAAIGVAKLIERGRRRARPVWADVADDEASSL